MKLRLPVMLAPVGSLESFDPGGAATAGRGATRIRRADHRELGDQAGARGDREGGDRAEDLPALRARRRCLGGRRRASRGRRRLQRVLHHGGHRRLFSRRERDIAARFVKPWRTAATGHNHQAGFTWDNVKRFKDKHRIPLILKGIATAEDAAIACEHGVDVVYVSNHGGRQLDHGRGSMDVLPEVMDAVRGRARVMIDGSFARGTDVVKAIALGADAVAVGRLYCYALAAEAMPACTGCWNPGAGGRRWRWRLPGARSLAELNRSFLHFGAPPVTAAARAQRVPAAVPHARVYDRSSSLRGAQRRSNLHPVMHCDEDCRVASLLAMTVKR